MPKKTCPAGYTKSEIKHRDRCEECNSYIDCKQENWEKGLMNI